MAEEEFDAEPPRLREKLEAARHELIRLNAAESRRFVEALLVPPRAPTPRMLESIRTYRKTVKSDLD